MKRNQQKSNRIFFKDFPNMMLLVLLYFIQLLMIKTTIFFQGLPLGLVFSVLPLILKENLSYTQIGYISLSIYPFAFKVLWSPLVDTVRTLFCQQYQENYFLRSIGRRKSWIIPTQLLAALLLFFLSYKIKQLAQGNYSIITFTILLTLIVFLLSTQDIAVDSWSLTILDQQNVSYGAACQSIGLMLGQFTSGTIFLSLNSLQFCKDWIYPTDYSGNLPILQIDTYLRIISSIILATTVYVLFKREKQAVYQIDNEGQSYEPKTIRQVLELVWKLKDHKSLRLYLLFLITCSVGSSFINSLSSLYLLDNGFSTSTFASIELFHFPIEVLFGIWSGRLGKQKQIERFYLFRVLFALRDVLFIVFAFFLASQYSKGENNELTMISYVFMIALIAFKHFVGQLEFGVKLSFHNKIADIICNQRIGGTYLTLMNCIANLGSIWPRTFIFSMMDQFGFFYSSISMLVVNIIILIYVLKPLKDKIQKVKSQEQSTRGDSITKLIKKILDQECDFCKLNNRIIKINSFISHKHIYFEIKMKSKQLGRMEVLLIQSSISQLLGWLNQLAQTDYPKIEALSDGIGFAHVLDSLHSSSINLTKINCNIDYYQILLFGIDFGKFQDDFLRNLRVINDSLVRLGIKTDTFDIANIAKGKFRYNMDFLQWLYDYATKIKPKASQYYNAFQKRSQAIKKQGIKTPPLQHLVPNKQFCRSSSSQGADIFLNQFNPVYTSLTQQYNMPLQVKAAMISSDGFDQVANQFIQEEEKSDFTRKANCISNLFRLAERISQLNQLVQSLQSQIGRTLQNHKTFIQDIDQIKDQRDFYYSKLQLLLSECDNAKASQKGTVSDKMIATQIINLIEEKPQAFRSIK